MKSSEVVNFPSKVKSLNMSRKAINIYLKIHFSYKMPRKIRIF